MTEAEWFPATDPQDVLITLLDSGRATERKLTLFALAWCRIVGREEERREAGFLMAERFADGLVSSEEMSRFFGHPWTAYRVLEEIIEIMMLQMPGWSVDKKKQFAAV